jgi:chromate transporter
MAMFLFAAPFPLVVILAGIVGYVGGRLQIPAFSVGIGHAGSAAGLSDAESALGEGLPAHARPTVGWSISMSLVLLVLWLAPVLGLVLLLGPDSVFSQIATFFSKMAVVTFGGAYAVLGYVAQEAVQGYGWLRPEEMLDGLGMAETTPGPLIQVVQFVGFIGAYRNAGDAHPLAMGIAGSVVTALVTFAPCFLFIFAGAPLLERLYERPGLQAALRGITAAVVGVILNLAVWFALHTLFAEVRVLVAGPVRSTVPVWATIDIGGAAIATVAILLAFRFGAGMFVVLGFGAAAGIAMRLLV